MIELNKPRTVAFLRIVSRTSHHYTSHVKAQEAVRIHLKELRKTAGKQLRQHIQTVDARITEAAARENSILEKQAVEEATHKSLNQRISALEQALTRYVAFQQGRSKLLHEAEKRIKGQKSTSKKHKQNTTTLTSQKDKKTVLNTLHEQLTKLEQLHGESKDEGADPARLGVIEQKIAIIRQKLSEHISE